MHLGGFEVLVTYGSILMRKTQDNFSFLRSRYIRHDRSTKYRCRSIKYRVDSPHDKSILKISNQKIARHFLTSSDQFLHRGKASQRFISTISVSRSIRSTIDVPPRTIFRYIQGTLEDHEKEQTKKKKRKKKKKKKRKKRKRKKKKKPPAGPPFGKEKKAFQTLKGPLRTAGGYLRLAPCDSFLLI